MKIIEKEKGRVKLYELVDTAIFKLLNKMEGVYYMKCDYDYDDARFDLCQGDCLVMNLKTGEIGTLDYETDVIEYDYNLEIYK